MSDEFNFKGRRFIRVGRGDDCTECALFCGEDEPGLVGACDLAPGCAWQEIVGSPASVDGPLPSTIDQHTPGAKLDTGKVRPSLILNGMARALYAVSEVGTFGAIKYTDGGWVSVPNGFARYEDAQQRHALARAKGETHDPESKLLHLQHEAWNALAKLDLYLREQEKAA